MNPESINLELLNAITGFRVNEKRKLQWYITCNFIMHNHMIYHYNEKCVCNMQWSDE